MLLSRSLNWGDKLNLQRCSNWQPFLKQQLESYGRASRPHRVLLHLYQQSYCPLSTEIMGFCRYTLPCWRLGDLQLDPQRFSLAAMPVEHSCKDHIAADLHPVMTMTICDWFCAKKPKGGLFWNSGLIHSLLLPVYCHSNLLRDVDVSVRQRASTL